MKIQLNLAAGGHNAIGLMSGTAHDGVSGALTRIDERRSPAVKLIAFKTYPYASPFRRRLLSVSGQAPVATGEISALNFGLVRAFGHAAVNVARGAGMPLGEVSFIGSHGHTFFHLP